MTDRQQRIISIWFEHEDAEPDISTERLFAMTLDSVRVEFADESIDEDDISEALQQVDGK